MFHTSCRKHLNILLFFSILFIIIMNCPSQWINQNPGSDNTMMSVHFINSSTGFLASNGNVISGFIGGEILRTSNGGLNWQRVLIDSAFRVKAFHFFDNNIGIAVGGSYGQVGYIYKTSDGGFIWYDATPSNIYFHLYDIVFPNPLTGYLGGFYGVMKTTNGGINWSEVLIFGPAYTTLGKIDFIDVNTGFFTGDSGKVYKTTNAGTNWQTLRLTQNKILRDVKFVNLNTGFLVGDSGVVFKSTNQGNSWTQINSGTNLNLYSIFFPDINTGYIAGMRYVLKTTNNGVSWFPVFDSLTRNFYSVYFNDVNTGYIAGDSGKVYKTTTGGIIGIKPLSNEVPKEFMLYQNYPNPFNPSTIIKFSVVKTSNVNISLYDALGRVVKTLVDELITAGTYEVKWNAENFPSGMYFCKFQAGSFSMTKKMVFAK